MFQTSAAYQNAVPTFSPDGTHFIVNSQGTTFETAFYEVGRPTAIWSFPDNSRTATFRTDGSIVAFYANHDFNDVPRLRAYSTATGQLLLLGPPEGGVVNVPVFAPDGNSLYVFPRVSVGPPSSRRLVAYSVPAFSRLPQASSELLPQIDAVETTRGNGFFAVAWPDDLNTVAMGTLPSGHLTSVIGDFDGQCEEARYSPDGQYLATGGDSTRIFQRSNGNLISTTPGAGGVLGFSRDGSLLVTTDIAVYKHRAGTLQLLNRWSPTDSGSTCFDMSDDARVAAIGYAANSEEGFVFSGFSIHELKTGAVLYRRAEASGVYFASLLSAPDLVLLQEGQNAIVRNYRTGDLIAQYTNVGRIMMLTPDRSMAVISLANQVRFLRLSDGALVGPTLDHPGLASVSMSADGQKILTCGSAGLRIAPDIKEWSWSGQLLAQYSDDIGLVRTAVISPLGGDFSFTTVEDLLANALAP